MVFYSLVPKNEPAPIGRGVKRNLGVPCRQAECLATGKTYDNRAFEDNELMAVIEQSPNTSDTRARPSTSPVPTQTDPSSDGLQEGPPARPTPEHSVIADTSLEPSQDTLVDTSLDEEKGCTLSHPSIQLQCVEDWIAGGPEYPSFPDALPPPSPSPYRSPSPSPPSLREEAFRSSLTLRTAELCTTPVRHSLSISHGNMPLLLSHCVSLGLTTVAVDVHFFPAASAASVTTAGQLNTTAPATVSPQGSQMSSRLAHSQENDLLISSMRQSK
ncbi:uncharacterized protein LOC124463848 [Hypomesus transpacificus]|uniref:uncharacterized protein LOC124463848 n=1 Tax=Hypomesus transpacificus TaxID=137520 RepID=UPI001F07E580|nr:uncharacterized protein LOC124463848 [Hypomesus transpacificus]